MMRTNSRHKYILKQKRYRATRKNRKHGGGKEAQTKRTWRKFIKKYGKRIVVGTGLSIAAIAAIMMNRDTSASTSANRGISAPTAANRDTSASTSANRGISAPTAANRGISASISANRDTSASISANRDTSASTSANRGISAPTAANRDTSASTSANRGNGVSIRVNKRVILPITDNNLQNVHSIISDNRGVLDLYKNVQNFTQNQPFAYKQTNPHHNDYVYFKTQIELWKDAVADHMQSLGFDRNNKEHMNILDRTIYHIANHKQ